jgi:hypothetical protein
MPSHAVVRLFPWIAYILGLFPMFYSMQFLGAYPVGFNRELDQVASSTLRNFRQTLFLEHVSRVFSEVYFRLFYLLCDTAVETITAKAVLMIFANITNLHHKMLHEGSELI